ncbi:aminoacyl-tRNA hydrolase [Candidatus Saccharibacteria bacterium]|nr:aminoacyl-tRNA hydrolase [Candidatus Saccharibacteria bacterium]
MKLVVGLGNPGNRYNFTRHNIGFLALDYYFKRNKLEWRDKAFLGAMRGSVDDVLFIKPQNFYNETGGVVASYMRHFNIPASDILVICDNFDLGFGMVRYRTSGSAGGNNGLKSLDAALGTSEYARIRIGTGNDELRTKLGDIEFVLSRFTSQEKEQLPAILQVVTEKIDDFID